MTEFILGLIFTGLGLALAHWLPFSDDKPLPRTRRQLIRRYAIVTGMIVAGQVIWLLALGQWQTALMLVAFPIVGGLATVGPHFLDWWRNREMTEHVRPE